MLPHPPLLLRVGLAQGITVGDLSPGHYGHEQAHAMVNIWSPSCKEESWRGALSNFYFYFMIHLGALSFVDFVGLHDRSHTWELNTQQEREP